jgi:hypothetical protein
MAAVQLYLQSGKERKLGWMGDESHVAFGPEFPGEKESVRWYIVVMQWLVVV